MENTVNRLIDKSIESFLMAIEVYNKPTIHYRIEGFSMFICNAWELLLKAHMMNTQGEGQSITRIIRTEHYPLRIVSKRSLRTEKRPCG